MSTAQSLAGHKTQAGETDSFDLGFPADRHMGDPQYRAMTAARLAFMQAYQAWLLGSEPPMEDAKAEADGTANALGQWNQLLLPKAVL